MAAVKAQRRAVLAAIVVLVCVPAGAAWAQSVSVDLGQAGGATSKLVQLTALITVLSLAPSLLVLVTAFTRIVIVLSLLRGAMGTQQTPPNTVLVGLALFLTFFVMQPVLERAYEDGVAPLAAGKVAELEGLRLTAEPFRGFMRANARPDDIALFREIAAGVPGAPGAKPEAPPTAAVTDGQKESWRVLVPAFVVGELRRAFEMGFLLYLPFLVIDMVIASVLMSLGMMMLPPNLISLPFKLIFFVMVDGWRMLAGSLVRSFAT